jgi:hypothetical protein
MLLPHEAPVPLPIDGEGRSGVREGDSGGVDLDVRFLAPQKIPAGPALTRKTSRLMRGGDPGRSSRVCRPGEVPAGGRRKEEIRPRRAGEGSGSRVPALSCRCPRCSLPACFGLLKGFGFSPRWRAAGHARFGLGFGFLLGYRAAGDGDDVVLYG